MREPGVSRQASRGFPPGLQEAVLEDTGTGSPSESWGCPGRGKGGCPTGASLRCGWKEDSARLWVSALGLWQDGEGWQGKASPGGQQFPFGLYSPCPPACTPTATPSAECHCLLDLAFQG